MTRRCMSQTHWLSIWCKDTVAELVDETDIVVNLIVGKLDPLVNKCPLLRAGAK